MKNVDGKESRRPGLSPSTRLFFFISCLILFSLFPPSISEFLRHSFHFLDFRSLLFSKSVVVFVRFIPFFMVSPSRSYVRLVYATVQPSLRVSLVADALTHERAIGVSVVSVSV